MANPDEQSQQRTRARPGPAGNDVAQTTPMPPPIAHTVSDPNRTVPSALHRPDATQATQAGRPELTQATQVSGPGGGGDEPVPGARWGDFEIGRLLGKGGMGSVYLGRQVSLDRPVAIKVLPKHLSTHEGFRRRFELEARAVARISSPHVVGVYGAGEHAGHHYFAMEYVEGKDLSARIKAGWRLSQNEALDLMLQAARGLAAAAEHHIVHRDIKPSNMMVTDQGRLKLMDFGLVKLTRSSSGLTMTGTVMGTVSYFSPEQGRGEDCDARTDIYALGVVMYEVMTGVLPFTGDDATSVIYQHIHAEPRLPSEINPQISEDCQAIILKCMQKNRDHRYEDAPALIADLELVRAGKAPKTALFDAQQLRQGATMVRTSAFRREKKGSAGPLIAVVVVLLAAGGGAAWWFIQQQNKSPTLVEDPRGPGSATHGSATGGTGPGTTAANGNRLDAQWLADTNRLLAAGELEAAQAKVSALSQSEAADPRVAALVTELGNRRAAKQAGLAQDALVAGDLEKAQQHLTLLASAMPDHPELAPLRDRLTAIRRLRQELESIRSLVASGDISAASQRLDTIAAAEGMPAADAEAVGALRRQVAALQQLLATAHNALANDDLATARDAFLTAFTKYDNIAASQGLKIVTACEQFTAALAAKDLPRAQRHIDELRAANAGAAVLTAREERLRHAKLSEGVDRALAAQDFAEAERQLAQLAEVAAGSSVLENLRRRVGVERELQGFHRALEAKDLAAATARLEAIKTIDGEREAWRAAQEKLKSSRLEEEAKERRLTDGLSAVMALVEIASPDLTVAGERLKALEAEFGQRDTIRAAAARIDQRRAELGIDGMLTDLDRAVLAGEKARVAALLADLAHREALLSMMGQQGLTLSHRRGTFTHREDRSVQVELDLTVAMAIAPEATLRYRYTCAQTGGAWQVAQVERIGQ